MSWTRNGPLLAVRSARRFTDFEELPGKGWVPARGGHTQLEGRWKSVKSNRNCTGSVGGTIAPPVILHLSAFKLDDPVRHIVIAIIV